MSFKQVMTISDLFFDQICGTSLLKLYINSDVMKWTSETSTDLNLFSRNLDRLERTSRWITDSTSLLCLALDQFSFVQNFA